MKRRVIIFGTVFVCSFLAQLIVVSVVLGLAVFLSVFIALLVQAITGRAKYANWGTATFAGLFTLGAMLLIGLVARDPGNPAMPWFEFIVTGIVTAILTGFALPKQDKAKPSQLAAGEAQEEDDDNDTLDLYAPPVSRFNKLMRSLQGKGGTVEDDDLV